MSLRRHAMTYILKRDDKSSRPPGKEYIGRSGCKPQIDSSKSEWDLSDFPHRGRESRRGARDSTDRARDTTARIRFWLLFATWQSVPNKRAGTV